MLKVETGSTIGSDTLTRDPTRPCVIRWPVTWRSGSISAMYFRWLLSAGRLVAACCHWLHCVMCLSTFVMSAPQLAPGHTFWPDPDIQCSEVLISLASVWTSTLVRRCIHIDTSTVPVPPPVWITSTVWIIRMSGAFVITCNYVIWWKLWNTSNVLGMFTPLLPVML